MTVRIKRTRAAAGCLLVAAFPLLSDILGTGVVLDRREEDLRDVVVVGAQFMNRSTLQQLSKELSSGYRVLIISAFENRDDAGQTMAGKGRTELTYEETLARLHAAKKHIPFQMMRLISIDGNLVVQTAKGETISRIVLAGDDPTMFKTGGRSCEILEVYFHRLPRPVRPDGRNPVLTDVYITSDRVPDVSEAQEITRAVQQRFHHKFVSTHIRADYWFLEDAAFPLWYPFSKLQSPPTFEDYNSRAEMYCSSDETTIHCSKAQLAYK